VELFSSLAPVIRVCLLIAAGFVVADWNRISLSSVTEIVVYPSTLSLVFT
jgi:hypothetical protein